MQLEDAELSRQPKQTHTHYDLLANCIQTKQCTSVCFAPRDTKCSDIKHPSFELRERDGNLSKSWWLREVILQDLSALRTHSFLSLLHVQSQLQPHPVSFEHLLFSLQSGGTDEIKHFESFPTEHHKRIPLTHTVYSMRKSSVSLYAETWCDFVSSGHQKQACTVSLTLNSRWLRPHFCCWHLQLHAAHQELPMWQRKLWQLSPGRRVTTTLLVSVQARKYITCSRTDVHSLYLPRRYDSWQ